MASAGPPFLEIAIERIGGPAPMNIPRQTTFFRLAAPYEIQVLMRQRHSTGKMPVAHDDLTIGDYLFTTCS